MSSSNHQTTNRPHGYSFAVCVRDNHVQSPSDGNAFARRDFYDNRRTAEI